MKKTLFIGLGGCGLKTVSELSKKLAQQESEDAKYMYLYIDTDEETRRNINANGLVIPPSDFVNLGSTNPYKVYAQATKGDAPKHKRLLEWATEQGRGKVVFPNRTLDDGAMALRMVGRLGCVQHSEAIRKALTDRISLMQKYDDSGAGTVGADIWVVTSSCGGTGSSISLDILYLINRIAHEKLQHDPAVKLVLFMPQTFIDHNKGNAHEMNNHVMNGYSYMWELNAFKQRIVDGDGDIFAYFSAVPWGYNPDETYDLCRYVIPVDVETDRNTKIDIKNLYSTTAEMLYYLNIGAGASTIVSELSNDIAKVYKDSNSLVKFSDTPYKWGTWLIPYGYHVIRKADLELRKYLKVRAKYEILRYGILGEEMANDAKVRDDAKKQFAAEYILPYLMDDVDGIMAAEDSVKSGIDEVFNVGKLSVDGLDANRLRGYIRKVDDAAEDVASIKGEYLEKIKDSINKGVGKAIVEYGIQYTWTLLQNVDDFYLTQLNSGVLNALEIEYDNAASVARAELEGYIGRGINKKNAAAAAKAGKMYADARKTAVCVKIVRSILLDLTEFPEGYLEVIRKGNNLDRTGLHKLKNIINAKVGEAESAYSALAKQFIDSKNDALTVYMPSLYDIANGENGTWAIDNEFEQLYHSSILDYDYERARGIGGVRVPIRNNAGSNNLSHYIQQLLLQTDSSLFVSLALSDGVKAQHQLDKVINEVLDHILDEAISIDGTPVDGWLKRPLEDYITLNASKIDFEVLTNPELIPVLYPMKAVHTDATLMRYLYVGASQSLAERFGFKPNSDNSEFVLDSTMGDRFQVIKMPIGLDFYSYKYFESIEKHYFTHRASVISESAGCHIHKAFRHLDIDKALENVKSPAKLDALRYFVKNLYYQHLIQELKAKEPAAYRELMGIFDVFDFASFGAAPQQSDQFDISQFLSDGTSGSGQVVDLGAQTVYDEFFRSTLKATQPLGMSIVMRAASMDTNNVLHVNSDMERFDLQNIVSPQLFVEALINAKSVGSNLSLMSLMSRVDDIAEALENINIVDAVNRVKGDACVALLTAGTKENPNFAILLNAWIQQKREDYQDYINVIRDFLNNVAR